MRRGVVILVKHILPRVAAVQDVVANASDGSSCGSSHSTMLPKSRSGSQQTVTKKKNVPFYPFSLLLISKRLSSHYPPMTQITQINQIFICFTKRISISATSASSAVRVFFLNGFGDRASNRLNILEYLFSISYEIRFVYIPWIRQFYIYCRGYSPRSF